MGLPGWGEEVKWLKLVVAWLMFYSVVTHVGRELQYYDARVLNSYFFFFSSLLIVISTKYRH